MARFRDARTGDLRRIVGFLMLRFRSRFLVRRRSRESCMRCQGRRQRVRRIAKSNTGGDIARIQHIHIDTSCDAEQRVLRVHNLSVIKMRQRHVSQHAEYASPLTQCLHATCKPVNLYY